MGAYINGDYKSEYSGDQIDAAIGKVRTPDSTPTASSDNLVTSGGVKAALDQKQAVIEDLSTIRSNATDGKAAYDKIDEGLAKSDLDAGVQASLDKADAAAPQSTTYTKTEVDNALATKADKNGSGSEDFNAKSVILPTTGSGSGTSQILGANSPVPGRYYLPDSASGGQGYTLATTDMVNQKADKDTDAVEGNLAEFDANGNPVDSGIPSTKIGEIEEGLSVLRNSAGIAEGIADTISAGTPQEFVFRQSGGDGVNYMKRIKGRSIVWNQLVQNGNFADGSTNWSGNFTISDGVATVTAPGQYGGIGQLVSLISGHKYYISCQFKPTTASSDIRFGIGHSNRFGSEGVAISLNTITDTSKFTYVSYVGTWASDGNASTQILMMDFRSENRDSFYIKDVKLIDLTLMFGGGNEPATVEEFRALYPDSYYPYNAGSVESNDASEIESVGRNLWDEEWEVGDMSASTGAEIAANDRIRNKGYIPVFGGTNYYCNSNSIAYYLFYDANKAFISNAGGVGVGGSNNFTTPVNAAYMRFYCLPAYGTTYNHDICINLSDASFNGQYEPYWKRRIELNIPELKDKDGNLVFPYGGMHGVGTAFDSMKPEADGFIHYANRVFARVDLGDLDWTMYGSGDTERFQAIVSDKKYGYYNIICSKYVTVTPDTGSGASVPAGYISGGGSNNQLYVKNSEGYADAAAFKAAMAGVYLIYEVATPAVVELAEPIPNSILVDNLGTEQAIFPVHNDETPSAPFACDSNYSISVKNLVAKLNALNG